MTHRRSAASVLVLLAVALVVPLVGASTTPHPTFMTPFDPQGGFAVQALVDGFWQPVGDLTCDRYIRERGVTIPAAALAEPWVRIRLVQYGGGAAHIDSVTLGAEAAARITGAGEADAAGLVASRDNDVIDAFGRTIELTFPGRTSQSILHLAARVEPAVNEGLPFAFPRANQIDPAAPMSFYDYTPDPAGQAPAWPAGLDAGNVLFAELSTPTTGHPDGVTYGWVANDRDTLYAEVEFTSDNTRDGTKDWASVTVRHNGVRREFRVAEDQTQWGRASFVATERAGYRHKLYAFAIPFSALGARNASDAGKVELAFAAYGTSAISWVSPQSHDFGIVGVGETSPPFTVTITNVFPTDFTLDDPWIARVGADPAAFPLAGGTCTAAMTLKPNDSCTLLVTFAPTASGPFQDSLQLSAHDAAGAPLVAYVFLNGDGGAPIPTFAPIGIALLALVLSAIGVFVLRRH